MVLRRDHLQPEPLAPQLVVDRRGDLGIEFGQALVEDAHADTSFFSAYSAAVSRVPAAVGRTSNSQPSPYGSEVTRLGIVDGGRVDRGDGAADRRVELGDGLGGLHLAAGFAGGDGGPDLGQVDEDQIAERRGGDRGDADPHRRVG